MFIIDPPKGGSYILQTSGIRGDKNLEWGKRKKGNNWVRGGAYVIYDRGRVAVRFSPFPLWVPYPPPPRRVGAPRVWAHNARKLLASFFIVN